MIPGSRSEEVRIVIRKKKFNTCIIKIAVGNRGFTSWRLPEKLHNASQNYLLGDRKLQPLSPSSQPQSCQLLLGALTLRAALVHGTKEFPLPWGKNPETPASVTGGHPPSEVTLSLQETIRTCNSNQRLTNGS